MNENYNPKIGDIAWDLMTNELVEIVGYYLEGPFIHRKYEVVPHFKDNSSNILLTTRNKEQLMEVKFTKTKLWKVLND